MQFILQAVNDEDHLAPAREVFGIEDLQAATISTAFMTASGLSLLQGVLEPIAERTRLFVGIRNGVTTVQSIQKALEIGCETYLVDTGSRQRIFHPKMYYARSAARAKLLLGSANLTMGGLRTNIEASVMQELDPATDAAFLADLEGKLDAMIADYPDHVIRAVDAAQLADFQRAGRLLDERKTRPPEPVGSSADRDLDAVPKMALRTSPVRVAAPVAPPVPPVAPAAPVARERLEQVWESSHTCARPVLGYPDGGPSYGCRPQSARRPLSRTGRADRSLPRIRRAGHSRPENGASVFLSMPKLIGGVDFSTYHQKGGSDHGDLYSQSDIDDLRNTVPTRRHWNQRQRRHNRLVAEVDLAEFSDRYVSLGALAAEARIQANHVARRLERKGIIPIDFPPNLNKVFLREEAQPAEHVGRSTTRLIEQVNRYLNALKS